MSTLALLLLQAALAQEPPPSGEAPAGGAVEDAPEDERGQPKATPKPTRPRAATRPHPPGPVSPSWSRPRRRPTPDALAAGKEAVVTVEMLVDETGIVLDAKVVEPVGDGFGRRRCSRCRPTASRPPSTRPGRPPPSSPTPCAQARRRPAAVHRGRGPGGRRPRPARGHRAAGGGPGGRPGHRSGADGAFSFVGLAPGDWTVAATGTALRAATETLTVPKARWSSSICTWSATAGRTP